MLQEFIHTSFGLVAAREYRLLREYFAIIKAILSRPGQPNTSRLAITAVVKQKEDHHGR